MSAATNGRCGRRTCVSRSPCTIVTANQCGHKGHDVACLPPLHEEPSRYGDAVPTVGNPTSIPLSHPASPMLRSAPPHLQHNHRGIKICSHHSLTQACLAPTPRSPHPPAPIFMVRRAVTPPTASFISRPPHWWMPTEQATARRSPQPAARTLPTDLRPLLHPAAQLESGPRLSSMARQWSRRVTSACRHRQHGRARSSK